MGYAPDHPAVVASLEAIKLQRKSWDSLRAEYRAWARVKAAVNPGALSNTGERYIYWANNKSNRRTACFVITLRGPWGSKEIQVAAPPVLSDVPGSALLTRAIARRDQLLADLVADYGEPTGDSRDGSHAQYRLVLSATREGRQYLDTYPSALREIGLKAATAIAYDPDGWSRNSSISAHRALRNHPERLALIALGTSAQRAKELQSFTAPTARTPRELPYIPVRAHARVTKATLPALPSELEAELHRAYDGGVTLDEIVKYWNMQVVVRQRAA